MKSTALKHFFKVERESCNQLVKSIHHQNPQLDTALFNEFLVECLDPLMEKFDDVNNQTSFAIAMAGFQHGLLLAALNWLTDTEKKSIVYQQWRGYFYELLPVIEHNPARVFSKTSNLLHHLYSIDSSSPKRWLNRMTPVASQCENIEQLEQLGVVVTWMVGMAHYRTAALKQLQDLPKSMYRQLFSLNNTADISEHLTALTLNRWQPVKLNAAEDAEEQTRFHRRVGQSELLGGDFPTVPTVFSKNQQLFVKSANKTWLLFADFFGTSLLVCDDNDLGTPTASAEKTQQNKLNEMTELKDLESISTVAYLDDTIALTSPETFSVVIVSNPTNATTPYAQAE